jgi:hypothetical protein
LLLFFFGTKVEFGLGKPFLLKNPEKAREGKNNRRSEILRSVEPFFVVLAHSKRTKKMVMFVYSDHFHYDLRVQL